MVRSRNLRNGGFTLIEVLISMVIIALAFFAITQSISQSTRDLFYLDQKTKAGLVANNIAQQLQLGMLRDTAAGESMVLSQSYQWRLKKAAGMSHVIATHEDITSEILWW